jgi:cytochrome c-type biogenesis protein
MTDITIGIAFIAGLVSFVSPCVLPLVPAYIGYMGGQVTTQVAATAGGQGSTVITWRSRFNTFLHGVFFVLGFTCVFVVFGLAISAGSMALRSSVVAVEDILARLGGLIIILFGLHVMGLLPRLIRWVLGRADRMNGGVGYLVAMVAQLAVAPVLAWSLVTPVPMVIGVGLYLAWLALGGALMQPGTFWRHTLTRLQTALYADTRQPMQTRTNAGYAGSALMGVVFSAGWTPCIGPVYGAVLSMAATGESLGTAGALLAAYSLGLGVPFLLTALALDQVQGVLRRLQRHMRMIELISGALLILIGLLVMSGQLEQLSQFGANGEFALNLEYCTTELFGGRIGLGEFGACMEAGLDYGVEQPESLLPAESGPAAGASTAEGPSLLDSVENLGGGSVVEALPDEGLEVGYLAPNFATTTYAGQPIALSDTRGRVTVINFWATWCGPCRLEMPYLQAAYGARADEGLEILAVDRGESPESVRAFQEETGLTFPLLLDPGEAITAGLYQVAHMPTTYVLDRRGVIEVRHLGPLTAEQLDGYLQAAFATGDGQGG